MPKKPSRKERNHRLIRQTGIRLKFIDALDEAWASHPRKTLVNHRAEWYLDGHLAKGRPLFGILALSNFAEYVLYHAKFGRRGQSRALVPATRFFAATRTAMFHVLKHSSGSRDLPKEFADSLRKRISLLVALAREADAALGNRRETYDV